MHPLDREAKQKALPERFFRASRTELYKFCGILSEPRWFDYCLSCTFKHVELPMRMPGLVSEHTAAPSDPFAPENLWFVEFSLSADMERETALDKAEILLTVFSFPMLPVADPGEHVVGNATERNHPMRFAAITGDYLTCSPAEAHCRLEIGNIVRQRNFARRHVQSSGQVDRKFLAPSLESPRR